MGGIRDEGGVNYQGGRVDEIVREPLVSMRLGSIPTAAPMSFPTRPNQTKMVWGKNTREGGGNHVIRSRIQPLLISMLTIK